MYIYMLPVNSWHTRNMFCTSSTYKTALQENMYTMKRITTYIYICYIYMYILFSCILKLPTPSLLFFQEPVDSVLSPLATVSRVSGTLRPTPTLSAS